MSRNEFELHELKGTISRKEDITIVKLKGNFDTYSASAVEDNLLDIEKEDEVRVIIVDMTKIHFIDSSGLGVLLRSLRNCQTDKNKTFLLVIPKINETVTKIMELTCLTEQFQIFETVEEAIESLPTKIKHTQMPGFHMTGVDFSKTIN